MSFRRRGFTLIELLVVIAIIAILAIVVVLTLNPGQLLAQARDSSRLSDLASLSSALGYYQTDMALNGGSLLGLASTSYTSLPDFSATSTAGDQCQGQGMPSLGSSTWHCAASSTFRLIDSSGWLPINLRTMSNGSPLGSLPTDPINQSSSNLFYAYQTNGSQYEVTGVLESQKYKAQAQGIPNYPDTIAQGTNLTLSLLYNTQGLVGYWPLDEATGTIAQDQSGNGNNGTWSGSLINGSHYAGGEVGNAGVFDGTTNFIDVGTNVSLGPPNFTIGAWVNSAALGQTYGVIFSNSRDCCGTANGITFFNAYSGSAPKLQIWNSTFATVAATTVTPINTWQFIVSSYDGTTMKMYINGAINQAVLSAGGVGVPPSFSSIIGALGIAHADSFRGLLDDVRIYNRALSAAEVMALYNAER